MKHLSCLICLASALSGLARSDPIVNEDPPQWVFEDGHWVWTGIYDSQGSLRDITDKVSKFNEEKEEAQELEQSYYGREIDDSNPIDDDASSNIFNVFRFQSDGFDDSSISTDRRMPTPVNPNDADVLGSSTAGNILSYHTIIPQRQDENSRRPGFNGAASNTGAIITWSSSNHRARRTRSIWSGHDCCTKVTVSSTGEASQVQWDRMGLYVATGQTLHGRHIYQHENWTQHLFYLEGEYDGWLLGPSPGENFGGIKNNQDNLCVHTANTQQSRDWSYFSGSYDTRDPSDAFRFWKKDDPSLTVRCVGKNVNLDSRKVSNPARAKVLLRIYKKIRPIMIRKCGSQLTRKLNMDVWAIQVNCAETCHTTNITFSMAHGEADVMVVRSRLEVPDLDQYCFHCSQPMADRFFTGTENSHTVMITDDEVFLYVIIVGYSDYVSLNVRFDSPNILSARSLLYQ